MIDMMKMLGKMKEVQAKVKEAQDNLVNITASGEAGAGMVKVTVNGKKNLVSVEIDEDIISKDDKEMIQDLIVAATNKALAEVEPLAKQEIKKSTEGLIPDIPGFDLSGMF